MQSPPLIMNFSGIYPGQEFYKRKNFKWLDCSQISGTDSYLDSGAEVEIKKLIQSFPADGIHFIDSGNYHYISRLWTDRIQKEFNLVVFDHHSDMQEPIFGDVLSCGSWIKSVLDTNPFISKVFLFGVSEEHAKEIGKEYGNKVFVQTEKECEKFILIPSGLFGENIYISIDKDVLGKAEAETNWDQGNLSLDIILKSIQEMSQKASIFGIDICGEAQNNLSDPLFETKQDLNDRTNSKILEFIESIKEGNIK
ncbi:MAG: arginase family protein [Fibrobacteraceae bacterium]